GYRVGLLDADIFGPSVPRMFDLDNAEIFMHEVNGQNLIIPAEKYGVKVLSMGFFIDPASAAVWRGAMASNALRQLIEQADWGELDYFLIDMPPGTSDIHLTLVQTVGVTGTVVVTTPQQVALADARKGIAMFRDSKINVPVLGLVENMAWFTPEKHPDERYYIFGRQQAVDELAAEYGVPVLARIPLVANVGDHNDAGRPVAMEDTLTAQFFHHLAHEVTDAVDRRNAQEPPTEKVVTK
ncbi:MAG: Mrp/NBP35 family ATP-binding protein, partial [Muribaculaceae bacterium]|nr:Mrp/NBP35 family ATP-binding protein [Muribaculaceae bacterium]